MKKALIIALFLISLCGRTATAQWQKINYGFSQVQFVDDSVGFGTRATRGPGIPPFYRTANGGRSWKLVDSTTFLNDPNYRHVIVNIPLDLHFLTPLHGFACVQELGDERIFESFDGGSSWNVLQTGVPMYLSEVRYLETVRGARIVFASIAHPNKANAQQRGLIVYRSQPNGTLPFDQVLDDSAFLAYKIATINTYAEDNLGNALAIVLDTLGRSLVARKLTNETAWSVLKVLDTSSLFFGYAKEIKFAGGSRWAAATDSGIYVSVDLGAHWIPAYRTTGPVTHIGFGSGGRGYATLNTLRHLLATKDSGKSWQLEALPFPDGDSLQSPQLGGTSLSTVTSSSGRTAEASWINRSAKPQRVGWLHMSLTSIYLGAAPKNDTSIHRLTIINDDTMSWKILGATSDNPHCTILDTNATIPAMDSATIRYRFAPSSHLTEIANIAFRTNDILVDPLKADIYINGKLPFLSIQAPPDSNRLQLGQTIKLRYYLSDQGSDTLHISSIVPTSNECSIVSAPPGTIAWQYQSLDLAITPKHGGWDSGMVIIRSDSDPLGRDTIRYYLQVGSDRVSESWSRVISSPADTSDAFATALNLSDRNGLLVGMQDALADQQQINLQRFNANGTSIWSASLTGIHGGQVPGWPRQIITDDAANIYLASQLKTSVGDGLLASFDRAGNFRWADTLGHDSGAAPFRLIRWNDQITMVSHGFKWYAGQIDMRSEDGQIGIFRTTIDNSCLLDTLFDGPSQLYHDELNTALAENLDDFPIGAEPDGFGGYFILSNIDVTDTTIHNFNPFLDKREFVLSHFTSSDRYAGWSHVVEGGSLGIDEGGNALIGGAYLTKFDSAGRVVSTKLLPIGATWTRSPDDEFNSYDRIELRRNSESAGLRWKQGYNALSVDPTRFDQKFVVTKLLTDAQSSVYVVGSRQDSIGPHIMLTKFDSLGTLRWTVTHAGSFRDTAIDAVLDPQGPIYVCGGAADSGGKYRPLIWKIEQDPIPGAVAQVEKPRTEISAYPNPFTREVVATVPNSIGANYDYTLIDVLGRKIASGTNLHTRTIKLNGESLAEGVYLLRISDGAGNVVEGKLVHRK